MTPEAKTLEHFAPLVDTGFSIQVDGGDDIEFRLTEAEPLRQSGGPAREQPFSLIFHAAYERLLSQGIYRLEHKEIGSIELFLVPVGQKDGGYLYQAVFN